METKKKEKQHIVRKQQKQRILQKPKKQRKKRKRSAIFAVVLYPKYRTTGEEEEA